MPASLLPVLQIHEGHSRLRTFVSAVPPLWSGFAPDLWIANCFTFFQSLFNCHSFLQATLFNMATHCISMPQFLILLVLFSLLSHRMYCLTYYRIFFIIFVIVWALPWQAFLLLWFMMYLKHKEHCLIHDKQYINIIDWKGFANSFNKHTLNTYAVLGIVLGAKVKWWRKSGVASVLRQLRAWWWIQDVNPNTRAVSASCSLLCSYLRKLSIGDFQSGMETLVRYYSCQSGKQKGVWTLVRKTCIKGVIAIRRHSKPQPDKSQGRSGWVSFHKQTQAWGKVTRRRGGVLKLNKLLNNGKVMAGNVVVRHMGWGVDLRWSTEMTERVFWAWLCSANQPEVMSRTKLD